jgi:hypothetical protein
LPWWAHPSVAFPGYTKSLRSIEATNAVNHFDKQIGSIEKLRDNPRFISNYPASKKSGAPSRQKGGSFRHLKENFC